MVQQTEMNVTTLTLPQHGSFADHLDRFFLDYKTRILDEHEKEIAGIRKQIQDSEPPTASFDDALEAAPQKDFGRNVSGDSGMGPNRLHARVVRVEKVPRPPPREGCLKAPKAPPKLILELVDSPAQAPEAEPVAAQSLPGVPQEYHTPTLLGVPDSKVISRSNSGKMTRVVDENTEIHEIPFPVRSRENRESSKASNKSTKSTKSNKSNKSLGSSMPAFFERKPASGQLWLFLEEPDSSTCAWWFAKISNAFILASVFFSLCQSVTPPDLTHEAYGAMSSFAVGVCQACVEGILVLECVAHFIVARTTCAYFRSVYNIIDICATLPLILRAYGGFEMPSLDSEPILHYMLTCFVPGLRLLKLIKRFRKFHLFVHVLHETGDALKLLLFLVCIIILFFSTLFYIVEPVEVANSFFTAMWMSTVMVTTVGYGDTVPITLGGRLVASVLCFCSVLFMAMPLAVIGNAFTQTWTDRNRILLMLRTRERLTTWGYTAKDMPKLFRDFDANNNGELCLEEFCDMIDKMNVGMKQEDAEELFETFDEDGSGGIDDSEFMKQLFPNEYRVMFRRSSTMTVDDDDD